MLLGILDLILYADQLWLQFLIACSKHNAKKKKKKKKNGAKNRNEANGMLYITETMINI